MNIHQATFNTLVSFRFKTRKQFIKWIDTHDRQLFYNLVKKKCIGSIQRYDDKYIRETITKVYSKYLKGYSSYNETHGYDLEIAIYTQTQRLDMAVFYFLVDNKIRDIEDLTNYWHKLIYSDGESMYSFFTQLFDRGDEIDIFPDYKDWMNVGTEYWTEMEINNWKKFIIQGYSNRVKGFTDCEEQLHDDLIKWQNSVVCVL